MAFDFGSDILVDAMRAADPQRAAEARLKLEKLASGRQAESVSGSSFDAQLKLGDRRSAHRESPKEVLQKFEAVVLSTFVQAMMPKDATSVFGEGLSGDMWKAQMAEKIGEQLAKSGALGIADRLLKSYQTNGENIEPIAGLHDPAAAVPSQRAVDAASQLLQQIERNAFLAGDKDSESSSSLILNTLSKSS